MYKKQFNSKIYDNSTLKYLILIFTGKYKILSSIVKYVRLKLQYSIIIYPKINIAALSFLLKEKLYYSQLCTWDRTHKWQQPDSY